MWCVSSEPLEQTSGSDTPAQPVGEEVGVAGKLCSHFAIHVVEVVVPRVYVPMQVPIYHCSLADLMVQRMRATSEGQWLADKLEAPPLDGCVRLVCGPDLEAITTTACIPDRCHRSCRTALSQILTDLGLDSMPPAD